MCVCTGMCFNTKSRPFLLCACLLQPSLITSHHTNHLSLLSVTVLSSSLPPFTSMTSFHFISSIFFLLVLSLLISDFLVGLNLCFFTCLKYFFLHSFLLILPLSHHCFLLLPASLCLLLSISPTSYVFVPSFLRPPPTPNPEGDRKKKK